VQHGAWQLRSVAARLGMLGLVGYLADPLKEILPFWAVIAVVIGPFILLLMLDGTDRAGATKMGEVIAAWWYVFLTALSVWYLMHGHRPPWWGIFFVFIAFGLVVFLPKLRPVEEVVPPPQN
jgi:hypothetical protein